MTAKAETTGKALSLHKLVERLDGGSSYTDATASDIVAELLANPEARMAVMLAMPDKSMAVEERRWREAAEKRATEAEARLPHLEEAAELLRQPGQVRFDEPGWASRLNVWIADDQALSAPTAESGKDSTPSPGVPVAGTDSAAEMRQEAGHETVASDNPGDGAGAVEATAGEAHPLHEDCLCPACRIERRRRLGDEAAEEANERIREKARAIFGNVGEPDPVAEAPERAPDPHHHGMGAGDEDGYNMLLAAGGGTHRDVRNYLHRLSPDYLGKPIMETLLTYVDKQEAAEREAGELRKELAEEKKRGDDHLAAYVRRGDFIAKMAAECGYKLLGEATVEDQLAFGVAALNRNLNGEIAEHQRHHDAEAQLNAKLSEAERKLADAQSLLALSELQRDEAEVLLMHFAGAPTASDAPWSEVEEWAKKRQSAAQQEPTGGEPAKPDVSAGFVAFARAGQWPEGALNPPAKPPASVSQKQLACNDNTQGTEGLFCWLKQGHKGKHRATLGGILYKWGTEPADLTPSAPKLAGSQHVADGFLAELGRTVRDCLGCGCLVAGGPTMCRRCAEEGEANG